MVARRAVSDLVRELIEASEARTRGRGKLLERALDGDVGLLLLGVAAAVEATGECRLGGGRYAQVRPVLDPGGLRWECTHAAGPHSSDYVAGLR